MKPSGHFLVAWEGWLVGSELGDPPRPSRLQTLPLRLIAPTGSRGSDSSYKCATV